MRKISLVLATAALSLCALSAPAQGISAAQTPAAEPIRLPTLSLTHAQFDWRAIEAKSSLAYAARLETQNPPGDDSAKRSQSASSRSGFGPIRWFGLALVGGGGALIAHGAMISDPCSSFNGTGVICASNYQTVRASFFAVGGATAGLGAVLLLVHHH